MHYHYFTLEQRDALSRQIRDLAAEDGKRAASALDRLHSPAYGVCEICEADIPYVQLLNDPFRRLCTRCKA
jgi:RNA polymerase-binding transcription factor DksA